MLESCRADNQTLIHNSWRLHWLERDYCTILSLSGFHLHMLLGKFPMQSRKYQKRVTLK